MQSRVVTLKELWQTCRACEDSCRRMADVLAEVMRPTDGAPSLQPVHVVVGDPDVLHILDPNPPCIPPRCGITFSMLADKAELLARRSAVLASAASALRDQDPVRVIDYYTCVPSGPDIP